MRALAEQDVCLEPVLGLGEIATHPLAAAELTDQPSGKGVVRTVAPPLRFGASAAAPPPPAPLRGGDTRSVLAEAGYTGAEVERLAASGVLG